MSSASNKHGRLKVYFGGLLESQLKGIALMCAPFKPLKV